MLKETLRSVILSQQEWLSADDREIVRSSMERYIKLPPFTYILTGVRRSGKSTFLRQIMRLHGASKYFNFEDARVTDFGPGDLLLLEEMFTELFGKSPVYFFDEIQNVPEWERFVRDAIDMKNSVMITCSNAKLMSRELGTKLTGRHLDYEIFPFSYSEYLDYFRQKPCADSFSSYLRQGGFPEFLNIGKGEILSTLVSDILMRDIFTRYNLRNQEVYRRIVQYLLSNTGKEISFNNLKNIFEIGSASSVMEFIYYLVDSYLLFLVPMYDTSLKVQARNPRKVYIIDPGLVNFYSLSGSPDWGRLLENTIFLHLRRAGKEVWYYKGKRECDFIVSKEKNRYSAIQASWQVSRQNEKREVEGLLEAMDKLQLKEGYIITFNQEDKLVQQGKTIHLVPGWKWIK